METVGDRVRKIMKERNLTQDMLADKSEVSQKTISFLINNEVERPRLKTLKKIAIGLGVPIETLGVVGGLVPITENNVIRSTKRERKNNSSSGTDTEIKALLQTVETQGLLIRKLMDDIDELKKRLL